MAGLTVASMLIPQSLAYAALARLPAVYGLYTAWLPLIMCACARACVLCLRLCLWRARACERCFRVLVVQLGDSDDGKLRVIGFVVGIFFCCDWL